MDKLAINIGDKYGAMLGTSRTAGNLVTIIVTAAITMGGVAVLFLFLLGGLKIIGSAGNSDPRSAGEGKQAITAAVAGFVVIFTSYIIVKIIETLTGAKLLSL